MTKSEIKTKKFMDLFQHVPARLNLKSDQLIAYEKTQLLLSSNILLFYEAKLEQSFFAYPKLGHFTKKDFDFIDNLGLYMGFYSFALPVVNERLVNFVIVYPDYFTKDKVNMIKNSLEEFNRLKAQLDRKNS